MVQTRTRLRLYEHGPSPDKTLTPRRPADRVTTVILSLTVLEGLAAGTIDLAFRRGVGEQGRRSLRGRLSKMDRTWA
ncbi:hypothetical protein [Amycolatopsis sp. NPDC102389]|uniref:hypothetical protein n=1 Tax=Amycolatopsis sp. NPDC102389 TaxID=3363941 RepID=UPI003828B94E